MTTQSLSGANSASFTTTAGTEAVIAVAFIPTGAIAEAVLQGEVAFTAVNAATTALTLKLRQATVSGGNLVVSSPAGTQVGPTVSNTFTAGTLSTQTVSVAGIDFAPVELTAPITIGAQAATLNVPGLIPPGGFLYVLTVTSTTNVATVAAQAAFLQVSW